MGKTKWLGETRGLHHRADLRPNRQGAGAFCRGTLMMNHLVRSLVDLGLKHFCLPADALRPPNISQTEGLYRLKVTKWRLGDES